MTFSPSWYTQHPDEEKNTVSLNGISLEQFDGVVNKAALSNQEREAEAIAKADGYSFQVSNIWFKRTDTNTKLVNNWLKQKGISQPMYADFADAAETLARAGLLDIDEASYAQHLDGNGPKKFKGVFTKQEFNSLDGLIANERQACIEAQAAVKPTDLERAFDHLPAEDALQLIKDAEKRSQAIADGKVTAQNGDSWLTLHPEFRDDEANAKFMREQLILNGVTGVVTIEDYERANRQLVSAGLIRQNPAQLKKQRAQEVVDRAKRAVETPGSIFDTTSEAEMYNLPLDELRRRASGNYSGSDNI